MSAVHSMTGFGSARRHDGDCRVEIEIKTVNNRFLKINTKLPDELAAKQPDIERAIRKHVKRGTVFCTIRLNVTSEPSCRINWNIVEQYYHEFQGAAARITIADAITMDALLQLPGVVEPASVALAGEQMKVVEETISKALFNLVTMRATEGETLKKECLARTVEIGKHMEDVKTRAPFVAGEYRKKLAERINTLLDSGEKYAEDDFAREVALFADRCSITEEIDRMNSHLAQFEKTLTGGGVIGRRLEFLVQEMFRETNTMLSKSQDMGLVNAVLDIKARVDELREQVANIE